jgi:hypothetical protein
MKLGELLIGPGRRTRPPRLCFILRGLPGSGKTHLAKLIKRLESADGDEAAAAAAAEAGARRSGGGKTGTRIHALDDYFMAEVEREGVTTMEFEHDPAMEAVYVKRERAWEGSGRGRGCGRERHTLTGSVVLGICCGGKTHMLWWWEL